MALGFLAAMFTVWRLAKAYDVNEEKTLDLILLTFLGGLIGARAYFVLFNSHSFFDSFQKIVLINRYPGLSFWGGLIGGIITLSFFTKRAKLNFWQMADFGATGLLIGLAIGDIGCFLGGCGYGVLSSAPFAAPVVGLVGKRFPISLLEGIFLLVAFLYVEGRVVRFHFAGSIVSLSLIILGIAKFVTEFARGDSKYIQGLGISYGHILALALTAFGVVIFYTQSKRGLLSDLRALPDLFQSAKKRKELSLHLKKDLYNRKIDWKIRLGKMGSFFSSLPKFLQRRLNVKSTPTHLR